MTTVSNVRLRERSREAAEARPSVLQGPLASYYLVLVATGLLLAIGFVMVLSASSVRAYSTYGSVFAIAVKQGIFIAIGLPAMWLGSRIPVRVYRRFGLPLLLAALVLLVAVLVPGIGRNVDGARRWIPLPMGFNLQPSELAKLGLSLWGADLLVRKRKLLGEWKHLMVPLVPVVGVVAFLVMLEPDMGTTIVVSAILMSLLWVVGAPGRVFATMLTVALTLGAAMAVAEPYRLRRLTSFTNPCSDAQRLDHGFQACQGLQALHTGGVFGLGLGASREKWAGGLPNPYTDYVFAIIGEELGLLGTLTVLLLFATLTFAGIRIAKRTNDPFVRLAATGITVWIAVQALVNMGTVVGLVPITGIPLPLISFGGSALILTLFGLGMLLAFARTEPGAQKALAARKGVVRARFVRSRVTVPQQRRSSSRAAGTSGKPPRGAPPGDPQAVTVHVVLAGGGSAGHVSPLLSTADALRRADPSVGISALGTAEGLESRLVPAAGYDLVVVPKVPLPRKPTPDLLRVPGRLRAAVRTARDHLDAVDASVVVGFGGYVSVPAYLAARKRGIPIVVHEANVRPGIANRLGARWAAVVASTVPTGLRGEQVIGLPLRRDITTLDRNAARPAARAAFGLRPEGPVLLVTGGSLGARRLNTAVVEAAAELDRAGVEVLHVTGEKNAADVRAALGTAPPSYHVVPYVDGMQSAYAAADLVLCRAGMNTCAELAVVGLPAVYVPLPIGNGEQALNAQPTVDAGGGLLVADDAVDAAYVTSTVLPLVLDAGRLAVMSQAVRRLGHPHADDELAALVLGAAR